MFTNFANIKDDEVNDVKRIIEQNLQSTVGYWTEEEVEKKALQWKSARNSSSNGQQSAYDNGWQNGNGMVSEPLVNNIAQTSQTTDSNILEEKRKQAKKHVASIVSLDDAKTLLNILCDEGGEWLLDKING